MGVSIGVVELGQLIECLLVVRGGLGLVEDLVGGWVLGLGPVAEVRLGRGMIWWLVVVVDGGIGP